MQWPESQPEFHQPVESMVALEFRQDHLYRTTRPHGSGDWLAFWTLGGEGYLRSGREVVRARPGLWAMYPKGAAQDYATAPEVGHWEFLWSHFQPRSHWLSWLPDASNERHLHVAEIPEEEACAQITTAMRTAIHWTQSHRPLARESAFNALETALLIAMRHATERGERQTDPRIRKALEIIQQEIAHPFRLDEVARASGLSVSRFSELFHAATGASPRDYAEQVKMSQARRLLRHTTLNIAQIANAVGYTDAFYFSTRFRKVCGHSPSAWRRRSNPKDAS